MRHRDGDFDKRFHAAKRLCQSEYPCRFGHLDRRLSPAFHDKRDHPTTVLHLLLCDPVLRMRRMEWVNKFSHLWMLFKELRNRHGILGMPIHADGESFDAAQKQK